MKKPKRPRSRRKSVSLGQLDLFQIKAAAAPRVKSGPLAPQRETRLKDHTSSKRSGGGAMPRQTIETQRADLSETLVDTPTAARRLGIGVSTLEKMRTQRRGPLFVKLTKNTVRYRLQDLDEWVAEKMQH